MRKASNNEIKLLRKLSRKKYRDSERLFIAEGERTVQQIIENKFVDVVKLFTVEGSSFDFSGNIEIIELETPVFEEVTDTEKPQGIFALCKIPEEAEISETAQDSGIIVATDAIQDPGNLGTMIRTAAWFGVKALIAGKGTVDVYHPKVVRSTAGATGCLPVLNGELDELLSFLGLQGWNILLLDGSEKAQPLNQVKIVEKTVLVVGNEANGVDYKLLEKYPSIKIEHRGSRSAVESLNAAIALGIALHALNNR